MRALLVLLFLLPAASGATIAEDDSGDHEVHAGPAPVTGARWDALDLLWLELEEYPDDLVFRVGVADFQPDEDLLLVDSINWDVFFSYRDVDYKVEFSRDGGAPIFPGQIFSAHLDMHDAASGRWFVIERFDVTLTQDSLETSIPRSLIVGADGAGLLKDEHLESIRVQSSLEASQFTLFEVMGAGAQYPIQGGDAMPNDGVVEWIIQEGLGQLGTAALQSDEPIRVSNGEATTFLFTVTAHNGAEEEHRFRFAAHDVPDQWVVSFPEESLRIEGGSSVQVPVLVTTPFNHQHGLLQTFMVTMDDQHDPESQGRIELGVRYTDIPQPAGHHDTTFIHIDGSGMAYFNTLEDDPSSVGESARHTSGCGCNTELIFEFDIPLLPGLAIGLDADLDRLGTLRIPFQATIPMEGVRFYGAVSVLPPGESPGNEFFNPEFEHGLFELVPLGTADLQRDVPTWVDFDVVPTQASDYVAHEPGAAMLMQVYAAAPGLMPCCLEPRITIAPGGEMTLPLSEYHDDVNQYFSSLSGIELFADTQHKLANPGQTTVFNVTLENIGDQRQTVALELTGNNLDWARVLGSNEFTIAPGVSRPIALAVDIPMGIADGVKADLTLHAKDVNDPNVRSLVRLVAEVDTDAQHVDEADLAQTLDGTLADDQKSPSVALGLVLVALALFARRRN